jgi:oxygen-independent coproporphyrinogen-3 oxidase
MDFETVRQSKAYLKPSDYYVLGSVYPPLKTHTAITAEEVLDSASGCFDLYVHIPFCEQHCTFCHFAKIIKPSDEAVSSYLDALEKELALLHARTNGNLNINTIYFGGGTASYMDPQQIAQVFDAIYKYTNMDKCAEITFELHPQVVRYADASERIDTMRKYGVNRWVFGVQSLNNKELKTLARGHDEQEVYDLLDLLYSKDISNISIDLIFGLPHQTLESWYYTLTKLVEYKVPKFNIFPLMFKAGDAITKQYARNPELFPDEVERMKMHFMVDYVLVEQSGYRFGPVFYYSKLDESTHSKQQLNKFEGIRNVNLLGIGASAFGYIGDTHYYNVCDIKKYVQTVNDGQLPFWRGVTLSKHERMHRDAIMTLRTEGLSVERFLADYQVAPIDVFGEQINYLTGLGLMTFADGHYALNEFGAAVADACACLFVSPEVISTMNERNIQIIENGFELSDEERFDYTPLARINDEVIDAYKTFKIVEKRSKAY